MLSPRWNILRQTIVQTDKVCSAIPIGLLRIIQSSFLDPVARPVSLPSLKNMYSNVLSMVIFSAIFWVMLKPQ